MADVVLAPGSVKSLKDCYAGMGGVKAIKQIYVGVGGAPYLVWPTGTTYGEEDGEDVFDILMTSGGYFGQRTTYISKGSLHSGSATASAYATACSSSTNSANNGWAYFYDNKSTSEGTVTQGGRVQWFAVKMDTRAYKYMVCKFRVMCYTRISVSACYPILSYGNTATETPYCDSNYVLDTDYNSNKPGRYTNDHSSSDYYSSAYWYNVYDISNVNLESTYIKFGHQVHVNSSSSVNECQLRCYGIYLYKDQNPSGKYNNELGSYMLTLH